MSKIQRGVISVLQLARQAQARPHPPFKRGFLPWICSQCVSIVCHIIFNALFIEEYFQGKICLTIDGSWIFSTRQITVNMSWVWLDLQLISNQCSELHREPRRQFIWTNGSFGPIIGWLQSLLLIALVIAKIWLSNRILQERFATRGPCNLCRLSARLANSTYSWKNNQEDSQSTWI